MGTSRGSGQPPSKNGRNGHNGQSGQAPGPARPTEGGSVERFVQLMNTQAKALGLNATTFKNPEGLTEAGRVELIRAAEHLETITELEAMPPTLADPFPKGLPE